MTTSRSPQPPHPQAPCDCVELTFELPDNAKECFHEIIEEGTESTLEFQVINSFLKVPIFGLI